MRQGTFAFLFIVAIVVGSFAGYRYYIAMQFAGSQGFFAPSQTVQDIISRVVDMPPLMCTGKSNDKNVMVYVNKNKALVTVDKSHALFTSDGEFFWNDGDEKAAQLLPTDTFIITQAKEVYCAPWWLPNNKVFATMPG